MTMHIHDVAIVGAGVAGSSLAKLLADRGLDTLLVDQKSFPRHKVCGEFLSPESRSMLESFGLDDYIQELRPASIERTRLNFSYGKALEINLPGHAIGVSRYALDSVLHRAATEAGAKLRTRTTVTAVTPHDYGYLIETKQDRAEAVTIHARAVIAAWGAANRAGLPGRAEVEHDKEAFIGVKSHFSGIEAEPVVELYFFNGGYLGISPIEGGLVNVAALLKRKEFTHADSDKSILGWIDACCRRNPRLAKRLTHADPVPGTQAAVAPVHLNKKPAAWNRIARLGDASIMIPPLCGDGMSMALRSAELCAPLAVSYLKGEMTLAQWEQQYTKAIRKDFHGPLKWGRRLQWLLGLPFLPRIMLTASPYTPGLAYKMVQATRLK
ncbi:NAD(P)/FAD-dependent oxidoreductase [Paenibacillus harenae]|uniref:Flavin-dependent dehydrogenase n=1 Tax=Paenibacillus harenae TaxID=306543 RepID=A0ABT9TWH8_PAEHA|nr:NAD(P)/FAD-dependent oxidoreductase [Paenibacillus harenae]MDQ0057903.1 flavin-dependent dehydrogenase [Paenibacillus harenae]MDQ0111251.1 flavin-dependent dehydrogenase [Paenibacillus harenae]